MRLVVLPMLVFCLGGLKAQVISSSHKKALKLVEQGIKLQRERDFTGAIAKYNLAIRKDSAFAEAYRLAGAAYSILNQPQAALPYYRQLARRFPEAPRYRGAHLHLAEAAFAKGNYQEALAASQKYLHMVSSSDRHYQRALTIRRNCEFALARVNDPLNFNPRPLPAPLNRFRQQYFPVLTADLKTLFFIKREKDEEIYTSTRNHAGEWAEPVPIDPAITSEYNEGTCTVSADGRTMVFTSCMRADGFGSCDLYITFKQGDSWRRPKNIGRPINTSAWDSQPALSADGRTLYYVSNRKGGLGKRDIWVSHYTDSLGWSRPRNLGPAINTKEDDIAPFIHVNGQTLYFASDGRPGFGGFDVYYAERDGRQQWGEPVNFGYPVNTHNDELAMFITADGRHGYYSYETRQGGELVSKLYQIDIPPQIALNYRSSYVAGKVYDSLTAAPLAARIELVNLSKELPASVVTSDSVTGEYLMVLTEGAAYALYISAEGYLFRSYYFHLDSVRTSGPGVEANIALSPLQRGEKTILNNVLFAFDSYALTEKSKKALKYVVAYLKAHPGLQIEIAGHTDNTGTPEYNKILSENRARAVYAYMMHNGIAPGRMRFQGYGSSRPVAANANDSGRAKNRRIELIILK